MPDREYYLPSRRLVSQQDAAIIESANVPRSKFTGAWTRKMTFDAGYLVPFLVEEILPGDSMKYNVTAYVRMSTPLFPIFDNQRVDTFFFFVPNRILWTNWVRFMGEQPTGPADSIAFTIPTQSVPGVAPNKGFAVGSLHDHMGLPTIGMLGGGDPLTFNTLPFRAYNQIWNQWFRDQNIINAVPINLGDSADSQSDYILKRRAKSHDYFTSALPWPQKFTAPSIPMNGLAPVIGIGSVGADSRAGPLVVAETVDPAASYDFYGRTLGVEDYAIRMDSLSSGGGAQPMIYADLSQATGVAINTFRQAYMVQSLLERDARGGTRYVELVRAHFGVTNPDFRVQRPEYIGGGQTPLIITPIAQTAPTTGLTVGALGGTGTSAGQHNASYAATEHGWIIGLINIRTELSYQQGMHRMWSRSTRFDLYWPAFAGLGEQAILRKELYVQSDSTVDNTIFGYQERWHEYRIRQSEVTGKFRSTAVGTLDAWHLAQRFLTPPTLSAAFIDDNPPMDRVLAGGVLTSTQQYLADIFIERTAVRPIPMFGTPALLGRF